MTRCWLPSNRLPIRLELKLPYATLRSELAASEFLSLLVLVVTVMVELPRFSSVLNSVPMLVINVPLLLFLKISFICLKV